MRRLLFLNGIKAFEAAARTGSFAAAGHELNVSAAAISRMVHLLEERLGVTLFERKANRLITTPAGRAYQGGLTPIFDALASLTAQVTASASARVLTVGVGPTFAMKWMIPHLAEFRKAEPDIEVRITTGGMAVPFSDDWSCGIQLGDGQWPGLVAEPLFAADLMPVCAALLPALAALHEHHPLPVLLFTSGTTGAPKAAVLRHRHLVSYILGSVEFASAAASSTSQYCSPAMIV